MHHQLLCIVAGGNIIIGGNNVIDDNIVITDNIIITDNIVVAGIIVLFCRFLKDCNLNITFFPADVYPIYTLL